MQPQPHGNGSSKVAIDNVDKGGWVRVHTDKLSVVPDDFTLYLSDALSEWFRHAAPNPGAISPPGCSTMKSKRPRS